MMNISLAAPLESFVDEQVTDRGYGTTSEYLRELIRRDKDRQTLRRMLLDGAASPASTTANAGYFAALRQRIKSLAEQ